MDVHPTYCLLPDELDAVLIGYEHGSGVVDVTGKAWIEGQLIERKTVLQPGEYPEWILERERPRMEVGLWVLRLLFPELKK